jgi:hypothetical protein
MPSEKEHTPTGAVTSPRETPNAADVQNTPAQDDQSDNVSSNDHVRDEKPAPGPTKWQKVKSHFARFKWWYLLGLIIFLAILLPLL